MTVPTPAKPPATRRELFQRLAELGIAVRTVEHPAVHTVAESAEIERTLPGGHTKNLFLKDANGDLILIVALTTTKIDLKAPAEEAGLRAPELWQARIAAARCSASRRAPSRRSRS